MPGLFGSFPQVGGLGAQQSPGGLFGGVDQFRQQNPGALTALGAGLMNGSLAEGFAAAAPVIALGKQRNMTAKLLLDKGIAATPEEAATLAANPALINAFFKGQDAFAERAAAARQYGLDPASEAGRAFILTGDLMKPGGGGENTSLTPYLFRDKDGNYTYRQPTRSGAWVQGRGLDGLQPVDPFTKASETASGKASGEAAAAVPAAQSLAQDLELQVNSLKNDPYLGRMLGPIDSRIPNMSADAARVQSKLDQLQGGAFLQARTALKGGGQITDFESTRAEQAYARLATAQNETDFKDALDEFVYWTKRGVSKLQNVAGQTPAQVQPPPSLSGPSRGESDWTDLGNGVRVRKVE